MLATVVSCGLVTVQDAGRRGYASVGVPVAGPLHAERYAVAVRLVAGDEAAVDQVAALELLDGSLVLAVGTDAAVAVVGPASCRADRGGTAAPTDVATHVVDAILAAVQRQLGAGAFCYAGRGALVIDAGGAPRCDAS